MQQKSTMATFADPVSYTHLLCLKYRFTAYVLLPAIILFNAGRYMMQMRYGLVLNLSVLSSMAETNFQEACAFCTPASIADVYKRQASAPSDKK